MNIRVFRELEIEIEIEISLIKLLQRNTYDRLFALKCNAGLCYEHIHL